MSRSSHLPPRYPFQRKATIHPTHEPISISPPKSTTLEEQPEWLDDLLSDSDSSLKGISLLQSASDSVELVHGLVPKMVLFPSDDEKKSCSEESDCIYGPNSPREKCNIEFSESSVLLALSEYVSQGQMQFSDETCQNSGTSDLGSKGDCYGSDHELNGEYTGKRHPGQRSRARKLEYIAELEKTVNSFEALELEMATKYSTLLQKRVVLSMENSKLKQQMARLQQQKLMVDGEYQILSKEAESLKLGLASSLSRKHRDRKSVV